MAGSVSSIVRRFRLSAALVAAAGFVDGMTAVAQATSYVGRSHTEDIPYANKYDCCEDAIYAAQADSIRACRRTGGFGEIPRGTAHGKCSWDTIRGRGGKRIYFCLATAEVVCRR